MFSIGVAITIIVVILGIPIFLALTGGGIILTIFSAGAPGSNTAMTLFGSLDTFTLMAIPFFLLAGNIMAFCGPSKYIFDIFNSWFGRIRGGLAMTTVAMCIVYAAITGSSSATLGGVANIAYPQMLRAGYKRGYCAGMMCVASTLGLLIPPSIYMIIYGTITNLNAGVLFISGIIPGLIAGLAIGVVAVFKSPKVEELIDINEGNTEVFSWRNRFVTLRRGTMALIMPFLILGGIYSGFFTPTEAGTIACLYGIVISWLYYRTINKDNMKETLVSTIGVNCLVFMLVAGAMVFFSPIALQQIPQKISEFVLSCGLTGNQLLLVVVGLYLVLGCILDPLPILFIVVPLLLPALQAGGINLIHFNVVTIVAMQIAQVTPPFGMALFVSSGMLKAPIQEVIKNAVPYLFALVIVLLLIIFIPELALFLPNLMS